MAVDVIIGLQRGDEGKGRFVDLAAAEYDVVARGNGGANAGHTVVIDGQELRLHQIPSGILRESTTNVIGNGVYFNPIGFLSELADVRGFGLEATPRNLKISRMAHLVLPHHVWLDKIGEDSSDAQGSTKQGIRFAASDKYLREGVRFEDVHYIADLCELAMEGLNEVNRTAEKKKRYSELKVEAMKFATSVKLSSDFMADTVTEMNSYLRDGKSILAEGAQGHWLDINHGMYPSVTSSSTTVNGLLDGLGIAPRHLGKVTGIAKVVKSSVGGGTLVTRIGDEAFAEKLRGKPGSPDYEEGKTSGRKRDMAYPDLVELRSSVEINGVDELILSKMDRIPSFGRTVLVATSYELDGKKIDRAPSSERELKQCRPVYLEKPTWPELTGVKSFHQTPKQLQEFVELFETELGTPVTKIGVGPERSQYLVV